MKIRLRKAQTIQKIHRQYLEEFLANYQKLNKSEHTIKNYGADLLKYIHWYEFTHGQDVSYATSKDIDRYKDFLGGVPAKKRQNIFSRLWAKISRHSPSELLQTPLSVGSKRRHISAIKNFYEYMIQAHDGRLRGFKDNPVKSKIHTIQLKDADIAHTKLLTERDFDTLLKVSRNTGERLILCLLYYGGLRLEELTGIRVSCFSQRNQTISLIRKGGSLHTFKLQNFEEIFKLVILFIGKRSLDEEHLFLSRFGRPISSRSMYARISRLFKRAGLASKGLGPHSFRKACATNLYIKTKDILFVRNYLNHKDAKVTQTYIEYYQ